MSAVLSADAQPYRVGPILFGASEHVRVFVENQIALTFGSCPPFHDSTALGVLRRGQLVAGVVYHDFRPDIGDCSLSVGAITPRWPTREAIATLLAFPFIQLGCRRISALVRSDNHAAKRFDRGIGFETEGVLQEYYAPDINAIVFGMLRETFLEGPFGKEFR